MCRIQPPLLRMFFGTLPISTFPIPQHIYIFIASFFMQSTMQLEQMSMGFSMDNAPWKRVEIDRAKWKVECAAPWLCLLSVTLLRQDIGDIMCVQALDGAEAAK